MQNLVVNAPNGAICCKLWPNLFWRVGGQNLAQRRWGAHLPWGNPFGKGATPSPRGNPKALRQPLLGAKPDLFGARPDLFGARPDLFGAKPDLFEAKPDRWGGQTLTFLGQSFWYLGQSFWYLGQSFWILGQKLSWWSAWYKSPNRTN